MFASRGEITPPCGVPASVSTRLPSSITPAVSIPCTSLSSVAGIPSGRSRPSPFGIHRLRLGCGRYSPRCRRSSSDLSLASSPRPYSSTSIPSTPGAFPSSSPSNAHSRSSASRWLNKLLKLSVRCVRALRLMRSRRSFTGSPSLSTAGASPVRSGGVAAFPPPALPGFIGTTQRSDFHHAFCPPRLFSSYRHTPAESVVDLPGYRHGILCSVNRPPTPGAPATLAILAARGVAFSDAERLGAIRQGQHFGARYLHGVAAVHLHWSSLHFPAYASTCPLPFRLQGWIRGRWLAATPAGFHPLVVATLPGRFLHLIVGQPLSVHLRRGVATLEGAALARHRSARPRPPQRTASP